MHLTNIEYNMITKSYIFNVIFFLLDLFLYMKHNLAKLSKKFNYLLYMSDSSNHKSMPRVKKMTMKFVNFFTATYMNCVNALDHV